MSEEDASSPLVNPRTIGGAAVVSLLLGGGGLGVDALWDNQIDRIDGIERELQVIEIYLEESIVCQQALVVLHLQGDEADEELTSKCLGNAEMIRERLERIRRGATDDGT